MYKVKTKLTALYANDIKLGVQNNLRTQLQITLYHFTSIFLKEWKYGDGKKNRVRDYCRF